MANPPQDANPDMPGFQPENQDSGGQGLTQAQKERLKRLKARQKAGKDINEARLEKLKTLKSGEEYTGGSTKGLGKIPEPSNQAQNFYDDWVGFNPGGAPVSPEFIQILLDQGYSNKDISKLLSSGALGGPNTTASFSSTELLDYFTQNPDEIGQIFDALDALEGTPNTYADYLAAGGEVGGYRSYNQQLQEAVLGIGKAGEAYMSGTARERAIAAGMDPRRASNAMAVAAYLEGQSLSEYRAAQGFAPSGGGAGGPSWAQQNPQEQRTLAEALAAATDQELTGLGDALSGLLASRQQRARAQEAYGPIFDQDWGVE